MESALEPATGKKDLRKRVPRISRSRFWTINAPDVICAVENVGLPLLRALTGFGILRQGVCSLRPHSALCSDFGDWSDEGGILPLCFFAHSAS